MITVPEAPMILDDPSQHTMADSLLKYVATRTHEFVDELLYDSIHILGLYDRGKAASQKEKRDKPENWQRPTVELVSGELRIYCFPGQAYVLDSIKVYSVPSPEDKSAREGGIYAQL